MTSAPIIILLLLALALVRVLPQASQDILCVEQMDLLDDE